MCVCEYVRDRLVATVSTANAWRELGCLCVRACAWERERDWWNRVHIKSVIFILSLGRMKSGRMGIFCCCTFLLLGSAIGCVLGWQGTRGAYHNSQGGREMQKMCRSISAKGRLPMRCQLRHLSPPPPDVSIPSCRLSLSVSPAETNAAWDCPFCLPAG